MAADTESFLVRLWGVRGSIPAPGPHTARYGGETTCIEVRIGNRLLIIDSGSGIRRIGTMMVREGICEADLLLTHTHLDHVCGLPFFCVMYDAKTTVRFWSGHLSGKDGSLEDVLQRVMSPPVFPLSVQELKGVEYNTFTPGGPVPLGGDVTVDTMMLNHPGGAIGYRISSGGRSFCSITDHEHNNPEIEERLREFVRDADVMIYDSMFTDDEYGNYVGWGHSTWQKAIELGIAANVKTPVIFHHDPDRSDDALDAIAEEARKRHPGAVVAHQGLQFEL